MEDLGLDFLLYFISQPAQAPLRPKWLGNDFQLVKSSVSTATPWSSMTYKDDIFFLLAMFLTCRVWPGQYWLPSGWFGISQLFTG